MNLLKHLIILIIILSHTYSILFSKDTVFVFTGKSSGEIYRTHHRLNIWDLEYACKFPAYPHHKYPFFLEANLMSATGGRKSNEMYDETGKHNYNILGKALKCILDSGIKPIIVLGNTPEALSDMPNEKGAFNANIGKPKNYKKYHDYIAGLFEYLAKTFPDQIKEFEFRLYTEPDFYVWFNNGLEEYKKLYDVTCSAMREGLRNQNFTPVLNPGNFMAPSKFSDTLSMFYPWSIAIAKWLKEDYIEKFVESFNSDLSKWDIQGNARIKNKELILSKGKIFSKLATDWKNYNLKFTLKSSGEHSDGTESGVLLNYKNDNNYIIINLYFGNPGNLILSQKKEGTVKILESVGTNIISGTDNKLEISFISDTLKIKLNEEPLLSAFVAGSGSGRIGFVNGDETKEIIIDNVVGNKYYYVSNFSGKDQFKFKGTNKTEKNKITLSNSEAILDFELPSVYRLNFNMKTDIAGEEGNDVGWLIFDYVDSNNYSAFLLNYHGYIEYKKIVKGQSIINRSSWTGMPKPYFYANFIELPEDIIFNNLKSGKIEKGVLKLQNDTYLLGYSNPLFSYEYRMRGKVKFQSLNSNLDGKNLIVFNYIDSLNFWGLQFKNKDSLFILKTVRGKETILKTIETKLNSDEFIDFDLRIGGDIDIIQDKEVWNTIENNITLVLNEKKILNETFDNNGMFGKMGFLSSSKNSSFYIENYLITYEGDSRGISPLDFHNFELINDDFIKILTIDGIAYAVVYDSFGTSNGKIGFKANNSKNVHISNMRISDYLPYDAGAIPRIPDNKTPRFSYSYYAQLQSEGDYQIGMDPKDVKILTDELREDISPYFKDAKIEVAEGGIYLDENGLILDCGDGTELGSAWNASIYKSSMECGLEAFSQWGYTTEELKSPSYNLFELLEKTNGNKRISVVNQMEHRGRNLDAFASKSNDTIFILIYNYIPNRQAIKSEASFFLNINELQTNQAYILEESRIDSSNSNFFSNWLEYCKKFNIEPLPGKSKYDMNLIGSYDSAVIEKHWKNQKEYYKNKGDDEIITAKLNLLSNESGKINIPLIISRNGVIFLKIYPRQD